MHRSGLMVGARAPADIAAAHDIGVDMGSSSLGGHGKSPLPEKSRR